MGNLINRASIDVSKYISSGTMTLLEHGDRVSNFNSNEFSLDIIHKTMGMLTEYHYSDFERILSIHLQIRNAVLEILTPEQYMKEIGVSNVVKFSDYLFDALGADCIMFLQRINADSTLFVLHTTLCGLDEYLLFDDYAAMHDCKANLGHKYLLLSSKPLERYVVAEEKHEELFSDVDVTSEESVVKEESIYPPELLALLDAEIFESTLTFQSLFCSLMNKQNIIVKTNSNNIDIHFLESEKAVQVCFDETSLEFISYEYIDFEFNSKFPHEFYNEGLGAYDILKIDSSLTTQQDIVNYLKTQFPSENVKFEAWRKLLVNSKERDVVPMRFKGYVLFFDKETKQFISYAVAKNAGYK